MSEGTIKAGQSWRCRASGGSHIVVGAIVEIEGRPAVACCSVVCPGGSQGADEEAGGETIPFLPLTVEALFESVDGPASGDSEVADGFLAALDAWQADPRGLTVFTVPYEGSLDRLIARQMASIVGVDPAAGA